MKAKVKIQFYDSVAKKVRKKGDVIDVTPERFNEIRNKGAYIEAAEDQKPVKA
jgi:hypothetical protein